MIWWILGIFGTLLQIGIMVGIVLLIVRFVSRRDENTSESVGVLIRRFFVYSIMLTMLLLIALGVAGLIEAALSETGERADRATDTARSIAFVLVGLPIYAGLANYLRKHFRADSSEQQSFGWAFYLTVALIGALLTSMTLVGGILSDLVRGDAFDRSLFIHAVIWTGIWIAHWIVAGRREPRNTEVHLLLGSTIGLAWSFFGAIAAIAAVLSTVHDGLLHEPVLAATMEHLLGPAMILLVGLPVWWWYWIRNTSRSPRTALWHGYVLLFGVLSGAAATITGAGIVLFSVLEWFLVSPESSASAHFSDLSGALATVAIGSAAWAYHTRILGDRAPHPRTEIDRIYDYLLAATGLTVAASGIATLLTAGLTLLTVRQTLIGTQGEILAAAITLLVIGAPLWWHYWSTAQRCKTENRDVELRSVTRRVYIIGLFGVTAVVAVVSLIVLVGLFFEDILEGSLGAGTIESGATPIALLLTTGVLAWYHFTVFSEDRADSVPEIEDIPGEPVTPTTRVVPPGKLEETLVALAASGHDRTTVLLREDGYEVEPLDE